MKKTILVFLFATFIVENSFANLRPIYLSIELKPVTTAVNTKNIIQWNVVFTNLDSIGHAIVIPSSQNRGKRIIQLQWYKVTSSGSGIFPSSGDYYEQVYLDPIELEMDTSLYRGYPSIVNLEPKESYTFPIFLNDRNNQLKHVESSYLVPTLPIQDYEVLVHYNPYTEPLSQHFFYHQEKGQFAPDSLIDLNCHLVEYTRIIRPFTCKKMTSILTYFLVKPVQRIVAFAGVLNKKNGKNSRNILKKNPVIYRTVESYMNFQDRMEC